MDNEFGVIVRAARQKKKYTLLRFATMCGMSESYLSLVERGIFKPPADEKIRQMADNLAMHRDDLMYAAGRLPEDVRLMAKAQPEAVTRLVRAIMPRKKDNNIL